MQNACNKLSTLTHFIQLTFTYSFFIISRYTPARTQVQTVEGQTCTPGIKGVYTVDNKNKLAQFFERLAELARENPEQFQENYFNGDSFTVIVNGSDTST